MSTSPERATPELTGTIAEIASAEVALDPLVGAQLGDWIVDTKLGEGAMCCVYRAKRARDGALGAIKVLQEGRSHHRTYAQRLRREAAVAMRIADPNIVKVIEHGTSPKHGPFLVMELLEGKTLLEEIFESGPLAPLRAARILRETARGLCAAHAAGYIHRDLKPGNLMLVPAPDGECVKILDFGIVGIADPRGSETQLTDDNVILGTPSHMAPEQFESAVVSPSADLYALGAILYHMLSGRPPFVGAIKEIIAQHLVAPPDQLPDHGGLGPLAHWLLEKSPDRRPKSAEQVIELIDALIPSLSAEVDVLVVAESARAKSIAEADAAGLPVIAPVMVDVDAPGPAAAASAARTSFLSKVDLVLARAASFPLRVAVPVVVTLALAIGVFAAREMLRSEAATAAPAVHDPAENRSVPVPSRGREIAARPQEPIELTGVRAPRDVAAAPGENVAGPAPLDAVDLSAKMPSTNRSTTDLNGLRRRLQRVSQALVGATGAVPESEMRAFEERYLDLSSAVRPGLSSSSREKLAARIDALHRQLVVVGRKSR